MANKASRLCNRMTSCVPLINLMNCGRRLSALNQHSKTSEIHLGMNYLVPCRMITINERGQPSARKKIETLFYCAWLKTLCRQDGVFVSISPSNYCIVYPRPALQNLATIFLRIGQILNNIFCHWISRITWWQALSAFGNSLLADSFI